MEIKNVCAMYFSATGTTEKVVKEIADKIGTELECNVECFDFTLPKSRVTEKEFTENDLVVFGVPVYAGRVPNILLKYIEGVRGNHALVVPIVLYGNRNYDDALIELKNILEKNEFYPIAAGAFIGEHSFSKILAAGRPDEKDMKVVEDLAVQIVEKVGKNQDVPEMLMGVKGQSPIRSYYQPRDREGNSIDIRKVKPRTSDTCIQCKLCAKVCPMGSISEADVTQFVGICIKCGACVKKCPVQAKYYDDEGYLYHKEELELGYERRAEPEIFMQ